MPQTFVVYPNLNPQEFLAYIAAAKGLPARAARTRIDELLQLVNLVDARKRARAVFSAAMKRRVGIAQALLNDPKLLIVDEPTAGLDPEERIRFRTLLAELAGDRTVLLSTHIVEDIAQTCRRLAVMHLGEVVFTGTIEELVDAARGRVWSVALPAGERPEGDLTVVSMLPQDASVQYRVVGQP